MNAKIPSKGEAARSYTVRLLHRRDKDEQIVGVVESVENGTRHAFISRDELWAILMHAGNEAADETKTHLEKGKS